MKVKCPEFWPSGTNYCKNMANCSIDKCESLGGLMDVEISTPSLIEELEKRRPCEKCKFRLSSLCMTCTWRDVWDMTGKNDHKDNFKEDK